MIAGGNHSAIERWLSVSETGGVCPSTERCKKTPQLRIRSAAPLSGAPRALRAAHLFDFPILRFSLYRTLYAAVHQKVPGIAVFAIPGDAFLLDAVAGLHKKHNLLPEGKLLSPEIICIRQTAKGDNAVFFVNPGVFYCPDFTFSTHALISLSGVSVTT